MSMVFIFCCDDNPTYCSDAAVVAVAIIAVASLVVAILLRVLVRPGLLLLMLEIAATNLRTRDALLVVKSANERGW